jgi:hypothetical protein
MGETNLRELKLTWNEIMGDISAFANSERESFFNRDSGNYVVISL